MPNKLKLIISAGLLAYGLYLVVTPILTMSYRLHEWILGTVLVVVAGPASYYYYSKCKSSFVYRSDKEVLKQAEIESKFKGTTNG